MQQVERRSKDGGRTLALWRALLWFVAIWAVAEAPLGTGLQSIVSSTRLALSADTGEERAGVVAALLEAETGDGDNPPGCLPIADTGDEPGLARWFAERDFAAAGASVFTAHPRGHCAITAPQSPFARGPPTPG